MMSSSRVNRTVMAPCAEDLFLDLNVFYAVSSMAQPIFSPQVPLVQTESIIGHKQV